MTMGGLCLSARRVKVDISDNEGNKFTVTFQGKVTRQKVLQLLDLIEILGGVPPSSETRERPSGGSKFARISDVVVRHFPLGWFSSIDVQSKYENVHGESIGLTTVSTYLNRLAQRGMLHKEGSSRKRYKLQHESTASNSIKIDR